jgi:hypothetical protein
VVVGIIRYRDSSKNLLENMKTCVETAASWMFRMHTDLHPAVCQTYVGDAVTCPNISVLTCVIIPINVTYDKYNTARDTDMATDCGDVTYI